MNDFSRSDLEEQIVYLLQYGRTVASLLEGLSTPVPKLVEERLKQEWQQIALSDRNMKRVLDMIEGHEPPPRG